MRQKFTSTGRSLPLWTEGDDAADALAPAAAAHHTAPQALTEVATKRQRFALSIHMFVAELLQNDVICCFQ